MVEDKRYRGDDKRGAEAGDAFHGRDDGDL